MDSIIQSIETKIAGLVSAKYVGEDWGQLDYYSPRPPVKFPCVLIDISAGNFENVGQDKAASPVRRQTADLMVTLKIADLMLTNTSAQAPAGQRAQAFSIFAFQQEIHQLIHGWNPTENTGKLIRKSFQRVQRDDGIREYEVMYVFGSTNI